MRPSNTQSTSRNDWWELLGLRGPLGSRVSDSAERMLRQYIPVGFATTDGGDVLNLEQIVELISVADEEAERKREHEAAERRAADVAAFETSFTLPNAGVTVDEGRWAGFTRGEATAWCWNLFQYEPHGFVHPGSQVRAEALAKLRAGSLPEVFGYPERARMLAESGMTPRQYREHREALGSRAFDHAEIRRS